jgi:hypothetical protein
MPIFILGVGSIILLYSLGRVVESINVSKMTPEQKEKHKREKQQVEQTMRDRDFDHSINFNNASESEAADAISLHQGYSENICSSSECDEYR